VGFIVFYVGLKKTGGTFYVMFS